MSKYKASDALKIKREIAELQRTLETTQGLIATAREELGLVEGEIAKRRAVLQTIEETIVLRQTASEALLHSVQQEQEAVSSATTIARTVLGNLQAAIRESKDYVPEDSTTFIRAVLDALEDEVKTLDTRRTTAESELESLAATRRAAELALARVVVDRQGAEREIANIVEGLKAGKIKYEKVAGDLAEASRRLDAIKAREHDSRVMHQRLSDDYQKLYNSIPHRHGRIPG